MTLLELKKVLNEFPPECDDKEVVFGEVVTGESIESVEVFADTIELNYF